VKPGVKTTLQTIAASNGLSLSATGATGLEEWVRLDIQRQQEALFQPMLRKIIREELRTFSNRLVFFLMRIAFAAEQGKILITNVLERVLRREDVPVQRVHALVDQSDTLARRNIIQKTPKLKSLLEEWEAAFTDAEEGGRGVADGNCEGNLYQIPTRGQSHDPLGVPVASVQETTIRGLTVATVDENGGLFPRIPPAKTPNFLHVYC
jgi:hypothetical protein